tara:strand:+ start:403 stop:594 length:192 start_codon:yes stop_codon:yes gene_type:complete
MKVATTILSIAIGTLYFITLLIYFTLLPSLDTIKALETEICFHHLEYTHCENGKTIKFGGGIK